MDVSTHRASLSSVADLGGDRCLPQRPRITLPGVLAANTSDGVIARQLINYGAALIMLTLRNLGSRAAINAS